jgi:RNA polymerase sigma factor (sigma-70 family)
LGVLVFVSVVNRVTSFSTPKKRRPMNLDPVALESDTIANEPGSPDTAARAASPNAHTQKIAELFRDEYPKLVHYLVSRTGSWPEARDVAAQAFAQVLEMRAPDTIGFLKAYVYRVARNLATDRARAGAIRTRLNKIVKHEFATTTPSPEPQFAHEQRIKVLSEAIETLRPTRKRVLRMRMWDELPYTEIESRFAADGTAVNERTLLRWYADALKELRQAILAAEDFDEARQ